ncbi:hypothetical protein [Microbacterium testaceum]|uniref:hypothetical protein n=1 Tax=Microbacterium testaceum TaxID=2033 RepID=UPI00115FECF9|nr:hypothetical protein [Microbacterium testaceum]
MVTEEIEIKVSGPPSSTLELPDEQPIRWAVEIVRFASRFMVLQIAPATRLRWGDNDRHRERADQRQLIAA